MKIKTIEEALRVLNERDFYIENISEYKWRISDGEFKEEMKTDEELISFAEIQKEELEE